MHYWRSVALACLVFARVGGAAQSTTQIYAPICGIPQGQADSFAFAASNVMHCIDFVPCVGLGSITQLGFRTGANSVASSPIWGFAFYNADGSTNLGEGTKTVTAANTTYTITGIPAFTLTAGTSYRFCWCGNHAGSPGSYWANAMTESVLVEFVNAFVTDMGTAANSCTTGDPPATTGSLTANSRIPPIVTLGDATP